MRASITTVFMLTVSTALAACGAASDEEASAPVASDSSSSPPAVVSPAPGAPTTPATSTAPAGKGAPYPLVFIHGMAGFNAIDVGPVGLDYWNHLREALAEDNELAVYITTATPFDTSEVRAPEVAKQIDEVLARTGAAKVNLVGHSQGGLDARVLASPNGLGYGSKIASVTTISTPHRGSYVADAALGIVNKLPKKEVDDAVAAILKLAQKTVWDIDTDSHLRAQATELSEKYMSETFNPKYTNDASVYYSSYAGRTNFRSGKGICDQALYPNEGKTLNAAQPLLFPMALFLERGKGIVNDGLVTVDSAQWGDFMQCVPADHLKEVGQINLTGGDLDFDYKTFFRTIVKRLRARQL